MEIRIAYTLFIVIWGLLIDFSNRKERRKYIIVVSAVLIIISGLRNMYVGPDDTYNYFNRFNWADKATYQELLSNYKDPVFYAFVKLIKSIIGNHFQFFLTICSAILIIPLGRFIYKESDNPMMSFLMFVSLDFYYFSTVCIRQSMAIGILLLAYDALKNRNIKIFLLYVIAASLFHLSALIFLLIYPLSYLKYNFKLVVVYLIAIILTIIYGQMLFYSFDLFLIDDRFGNYQIYEHKTLSASGLIQLCIYALFFFMFYRKIKNDIPQTASLHGHLLSLAMIFQALVFVVAEFFRIAWYFQVYTLILVPLILKYTGKDKKTITFFFTLLFLAYFFLRVGDYDYAFYWQYYVPNF